MFKLWFLVDGIYPELACSTKTVQDPGNAKAKNFPVFLTMRQETVERRWANLHDWDKHHELKSAIMEQLWTERSSIEE